MLPVLYSFRRCPYAMRARYVIAFLGVSVQLREVVLKSKPAALLELGGRSSVPQLVDVDGIRYPESLDIIIWALSKSGDSDLVNQLWPLKGNQQNKMKAWIAYNDKFFKHWLDRYKYADRYPESSESYYRDKGEVFLRRLDKRLSRNEFLLGESMSVADIAVFPFIRQFSGVNQGWFELSQYNNVKRWLAEFVNSEMFKSVVMVKYAAWEAGQEDILFPAH
ncbi:glutathione S-transferase [Marinomonas sp.]|uniref:glutathione S-transferase n=1 Tax=Marinomonas sp. TaxID=1904862 RepID=UPI003BAB2E40